MPLARSFLWQRRASRILLNSQPNAPAYPIWCYLRIRVEEEFTYLRRLTLVMLTEFIPQQALV